jgi:hypothetical protein
LHVFGSAPLSTAQHRSAKRNKGKQHRQATKDEEQKTSKQKKASNKAKRQNNLRDDGKRE